MNFFEAFKKSTLFYIIKQFILLLIIFQIFRVLFYILSYYFFSFSSIADYVQIFLHSLRFDIATVATINFPYVFLMLLPFSFMSIKWIQKALLLLFLISNSFCFLFEIVDMAYFPYVHKRMSIDVLNLVGNQSDFLNLLPSYIVKFWFIPLLLILFILFLIFVNKKINKPNENHFSWKTVSFFLLGILSNIISMRGGVQLRPISLNNAVITSISNVNIPLVYNTTFSILKSIETNQLEEYRFVENSELTRFFNPIQHFYPTEKFQSKNVVIIILESFGKQYTSIGGRTSFTPFLDSLMKHSLVFPNAYANAFRSADAIPAIISSIPYMMNDAFPFSRYATNKIDALPSILKNKKYSSSFFHGGTNGTMNFDSYSQSAGYDQYFGRKEYNNDEDYDGTWGIWDEPFLQFFAQKLSQQKQPFFSTVFTLSSHEPFHLPDGYDERTDVKLTGIESGIAYTDYALKKFFETASKQPWYQNTLFIISADHNFLAYDDPEQYYNQSLGIFSIPILFFSPTDKNLQGVDTTLIQQIDIMPTVLDYLHYDKPFFSFGNSIWNKNHKPFLFAGISSVTYYYTPPMLLTANDTNIGGYFNFKKDSMLLQNLIHQRDSSFDTQEKNFKIYMQLLHYGLIKNQQSVETFHPEK